MNNEIPGSQAALQSWMKGFLVLLPLRVTERAFRLHAVGSPLIAKFFISHGVNGDV